MRHLAKVAILMIVVGTLCIPAWAQSDDKERAAITAANAWLALVDNGEYGKSWEESAKYFQDAVAKTLWEQQLSAGRKPLGKLISRKVRSAQYSSSLPGAPDGEYVVIQYETSFEHKKASIETVTPMKEADGQWKVSGYYIK